MGTWYYVLMPLAEALLHVLWHFLAGLAVYFGSLSDAQVRYSAHGIGRAVDDPDDPWPLVWLWQSWQRPESTKKDEPEAGEASPTSSLPSLPANADPDKMEVHFFNSVASLLSQLARNVVEQSLEEYVTLFRRFEQTPLHYSAVKALTSQDKWQDDMLVNKLVVDQQGEVRFKHDIDFVHARLVQPYRDCITCLRELPRPDTKLKEMVSRTLLWQVKEEEQHIKAGLDQLEQIVEMNLANMAKALELYEPFKFLLVEEEHTTAFFEDQSNTREKFTAYLQHLRDTVTALRSQCPNILMLQLIRVDATEVNQKLEQCAEDCIAKLLKSLAVRNQDRSSRLVKQFEHLNGRIMRQPENEEQLVELETAVEEAKAKVLPSLLEEYEDIKAWLFLAWDQEYVLTDEDYNAIWAASQWKTYGDNIAEREKDLELDRMNIEGKLISRRTELQEELANLMTSVQKFKEKGQVRYLEEYLEDLSSIKKNLTALQARCERIQYEEELVGFEPGEFEINDAFAAVEPYDKLWNLVFEHKKAHQRWTRTPLFGGQISPEVFKDYYRAWATGIRAGMSSYYGEGWATYGVELDSFEGPPVEAEQSDSSGWANWSRGSHRSRGDFGNVESYDIASNASYDSSNVSWWRADDRWSYGSWGDSSNSSRENWAYVTRREWPGWDRSDPWHRWHEMERQGQDQRSGECERHDGEAGGPPGESDGEERPKGELPTGKVVSVHEKADKDEEKKTAGKVSTSYPPVFRARQGENYRDWKRSVRFWLHGEGQQLPTSLVGPRVMVQLRDRAAQLVKHLEPEHVDGKDGLEKIFAVLEKSPIVRLSEKHRVDWHRKRLLSLTRLAGESLESYITRAGLYRDQLQSLDESLSMGERFFVGHLLDHAKLTRRDKAMVKTHAIKEDEISITSALMELSAELEGEAGFPIGQAEAQISGAQGEEHLVQRGVLGFKYKKDKPALAAEMADLETATNASLEGLAEEPPGEDSCEEMEGAPMDVLHAEHEALALQYKAKQKMAEVKKLRNFYRRSENDSKKGTKGGKCFVCDEVGHYARDCPKVKAALATNPVLVAVSEAKKGAKDDHEWGLLEELCCSNRPAESSAKAAYMVLMGCDVQGLEVTPKNVFSESRLSHETWWNMTELSKKVILDLGCMRNVVGIQWANDVVREWQQQNRWFRVLPEEEVFRFGDGNTLKSRYRLQMEATFGGRRVLLAFSVVGGPCPPLLSKQSHTMLGVQLDTSNHTMSSRKLKVKNYGLQETKAGHYTVRIDEFNLLEDAWHVQPDFVMEADAEVMLTMDMSDEAFSREVFGSQLVRDNAFRIRSDEPPNSESTAMPSDEEEEGSFVMTTPSKFTEAQQMDSAVGRGENLPEEGAASEHGRGHQASRSRSRSQGRSCSGNSEGLSSTHTEEASPITTGSSSVGGRTRQSRDCGDGGDPGPHRGRAEGDPSPTSATRSSGQAEAGDSSADGMGSQVSLSEQRLQRRPRLQCHEEYVQSPEDVSLEEDRVATSSEDGSAGGVEGSSNVEEESAMAEPPSELRSGITVGTLRGDETAPEECRFPGTGSWKRVIPQRGLIQKFKQAVSAAKERHVAVMQVRHMKEHYVVLELFAGCARLTSTARARDGWDTINPIDIIYGQDLHNAVTRREVLDAIRLVKPDLVTMSPRCGPWSQLQRINPNMDKVMEDRQADIPLWRFCRAVWDEQDKNGRLALTENPHQSAALTMDFMESRPHLHRAKVPQCAFGLKDVVSGKPHQKYTAFDVNDADMCAALMEGAICNHTPEEHQPIEGNVFYEGRWQRRSALAAKWPQELCDHILNAAEKAWEKCDEDAPRKLTEAREAGRSHYVMPVEPFPTPEGELRKQLEKADWRGGQYDYVFFEGTARQGPHQVRQVLAHLHVVLGHPSAERLTRMLLISGASPKIIEMVKGLRCQICQAVRPPGAEPKVSGHRPTRFGEKVLADSFYVWDVKGERFNVTHLIDGLTEFHTGNVSKQVGAEITADLLQHKWCGILGAPEVFQTDGGKEFEDVVQRLAKLLDFRHEVVPPGAKWRQGQVERHGAIIKLMMMRVILTHNISGLEDMKLVATSCFNAKNRLCNRMGLSPLQAVTGRNTVVPTSVMEQLCSGQVKCTVNDELTVKEALRRAERIRAAAVDSFNWIDSSETIRKALNVRSRPPKLENLQEGMTVYVHEPPPSRRGQHRRLQDHSSWDGPGLVVCIEKQDGAPRRVWVRLRAKVRSFPLEKIRLATPDEMLGSQYVIQAMNDVMEKIKEGKLPLEENQREAVFKPGTPAPAGFWRRGADMDDNYMLDDQAAAVRARQVRRLELQNDVPEQVRKALSSGSSSATTSVALVRGLQPDERADLLAEDDMEEEDDDMPTVVDDPYDEGDAEMVGEAVEPSTMAFQQKKQLFEDIAKNQKGIPSKLTEARLRSGMATASAQLKGIKKLIKKSRSVQGNAEARRRRSDRQMVSSMVMYAESVDRKCEKVWSDVSQELEMQEAFWAQPDICKHAEEELMEQIETRQAEHAAAVAESKVVTGKARVELQWQKMDELWRAAFKEPILKAIQIYFDHDALAGVPKDKFIDPKRVLSSRFVLTNKGGYTLDKAELKGRLILGGHKDPDMGRYATLAPTAALLAHNLINWISVQMGWVVHYEDVSSAFLQGKHLPAEREVYVRLPKGYPDYVEAFIREKLGEMFRQDLLQLTKGGFGLPESPRLWYLEYSDVLKICGMKELLLLPGVFAAFHDDGTLRALACIHVDDTRYAGDSTSQAIWDEVHRRLRFGKLRKATDGWTKFCGRWERQNDKTLEFEYTMNDYAKNLQKMTIRASSENVITPAEKLEMSSLIGQLNWMSRQGRYDLSYGEQIQVVKKLDDWQNFVVISASDASYGGQPGGHSQGGVVVGLADQAILNGQGKICIVEAASMKIQRIVRCSMSAEVSMAATAFEHGDFVRAALSEMLHKDFCLKRWKLWGSKWPHFLVMDAKTGFDVLTNESQTTDRKIQIDLAVLKQALMEGDTNAFVKWVPGHHIISDTLTKWYGNGALIRALEAGMWSLKDTEEASNLRKEAAKKRQLYKENAQNNAHINPIFPLSLVQSLILQPCGCQHLVPEVESEVMSMWRLSFKLKAGFEQEGSSKPAKVAEKVKNDLDAFKENVPLLHALCNPGLRQRHWSEISNVIGFEMGPDPTMTLNKALDVDIGAYVQKISEISESAAKEYQIESGLEGMIKEWEPVVMEFKDWGTTGTYIVAGTSIDEVQTLLDDHVIKTQTMKGSPYAAEFKDRLEDWEKYLTAVQDVVDVWLKVQGVWLYLEPIFSSEDIMQQMPTEGRLFREVDGTWRQIMAACVAAPKALEVFRQDNFLGNLTAANDKLETVQKGLNDYLETKRLFFPRFFFLSNDNLLEILSETKDPKRVNAHVKKCFEGMQSLQFEENLNISGMISPEKELVPMTNYVDPVAANGAVEKWLVQVEDAMLESIRDQSFQSRDDYVNTAFVDWVQKWPGQVVIGIFNLFWTAEVNEALGERGNAGLVDYATKLDNTLTEIVNLVRREIPKLVRCTLEALIVIFVHNKDTIVELRDRGTSEATDFDWLVQLRYFIEENPEKPGQEDIFVRITNSHLGYAYEYLGNCGRLVVTPLTDRCYRTCCGALHLLYGAAPEGPAGTGKTETVKDLAKALARFCVVFNCSDELDVNAMAKFFKGLASSGGWACFDEFNRIDAEVLSVIAQQILQIQNAIKARFTCFEFEGTANLPLKWTCNCFITMNPGYAGRAELPDNLKALFRTVAMMVPDYAMIAEIKLYSYGYADARSLAQKIVTTYKLCSEQLSSQKHYDYGMRAVFSVLVAAGNLKRKYPTEKEEILMLRSICDVNLAKFLAFDVPLFKGITSDLFPGVVLPEPDFGALTTKLGEHLNAEHCQPHPYFIEKIIQFYECHIVRHSVMLVGMPFSGKTTALNCLQKTLTDLANEGIMHAGCAVHQARLNPKSIPAPCLYGTFDEVSKEWADGIVAVLFREKLCLNSGEIIAMSPNMRTIMEPMDVNEASPATISRNGMVFFEPHLMGNSAPGEDAGDLLEMNLGTWEVAGQTPNLSANEYRIDPLVEKNFLGGMPEILDEEEVAEVRAMVGWLFKPSATRCRQRKIRVWCRTS
eukprot:s2361_g3.t1